MSQEEIERELRMKQMANRDELEKVKARRQEREAEKTAREEETASMQRSKEADQFREWQKSEDQFHLEQAKLRSAIRIQVNISSKIHFFFNGFSLIAEFFAFDRTEGQNLSMSWPNTSTPKTIPMRSK